MYIKKLLGIFLLLIFFLPDGMINAQACPDRHPSLIPAPLTEEWAVEWWMPRHEQKLTEAGRQSAEILLVGDSITHGWETTGKDIWQEYFGTYPTYNIGYSGDRTENVLWRFNHGEIEGINPKVAVVMIGTNNTGHRQDPATCTASGIEHIVNQLHNKLSNTQIILLAIFPREASPDGNLRQINQQINNSIQSLGEVERVTFLDLNSAFLNADGTLPVSLMPDLLHPNSHGYRIWAENLKPFLTEILE